MAFGRQESRGTPHGHRHARECRDVEIPMKWLGVPVGGGPGSGVDVGPPLWDP